MRTRGLPGVPTVKAPSLSSRERVCPEGVGTPRGRRLYNKESMKARVHVTLKPTVLDPQGKTICSALAGLGHKNITGVRQGKFFDITLDTTASTEVVLKEIKQIASDVLANPVIEEYRVEILD